MRAFRAAYEKWLVRFVCLFLFQLIVFVYFGTVVGGVAAFNSAPDWEHGKTYYEHVCGRGSCTEGYVGPQMGSSYDVWLSIQLMGAGAICLLAAGLVVLRLMDKGEASLPRK